MTFTPTSRPSKPTDDEFADLLEECEDLLELLNAHGPVLRRAASQRGSIGYPSSSMGGGGSSGSGHGDPTGTMAVGNVVGETRNDTAVKARQMERELTDARNRLRTAVDAIRRALPKQLPEAQREVCASCGVAKSIAKGWVRAVGKCKSCVRREQRRGQSAQVGRGA